MSKKISYIILVFPVGAYYDEKHSLVGLPICAKLKVIRYKFVTTKSSNSDKDVTGLSSLDLNSHKIVIQRLTRRQFFIIKRL
jgi:hypothetical protein